jgi:hypothetical protein
MPVANHEIYVRCLTGQGRTVSPTGEPPAKPLAHVAGYEEWCRALLPHQQYCKFTWYFCKAVDINTA